MHTERQTPSPPREAARLVGPLLLVVGEIWKSTP